MGKEKSKGGVPNKHLHARIAYLEQAATYLTQQAHPKIDVDQSALDNPEHTGSKYKSTGPDATSTTTYVAPQSISAPDRLTSHALHIAKRSQIRLQPPTKHKICKRCSSILIEGQTSRKFVENLSKRTKEFPEGKPWADVLVVECEVCGARKRWPVGAKRQVRKELRASKKDSEMKSDEIESMDVERSTDYAAP